MNSGVFFLLFVVIFVLVGVVYWAVKDSPPEKIPIASKFEEDNVQEVPEASEEEKQWLEDLARRQAESGTRRLH
jgi:hypothetical protein